MTKHTARNGAAVVLIILALATAFYFSPMDSGDDWQTFRAGSLNILSGQSIYTPFTHTRFGIQVFNNPPHVAFLLLPFAVLPERAGWAVLCALTLVSVVALGYFWRFPPSTLLAALLSPFVLYLLLHGQVDAVLMAVVLLPRWTWVAAALGKPQAAAGLALESLRDWRAWLLLLALVLLVVVYRYWEAIDANAHLVDASFNVWRGIWPLQVPVGIALVLSGWHKRDVRLLLAASPLLVPYATIGSLLPIWIAACASLNRWVALATWAAIWLVLLRNGL